MQNCAPKEALKEKNIVAVKAKVIWKHGEDCYKGKTIHIANLLGLNLELNPFCTVVTTW